MSAAAVTVVKQRSSVSYDTDRPTEAQYTAFAQMFLYFNEHLFERTLPQPILTFSRRARASGFFAANRWSARADEKRTVSEIAVNPDRLKSVPPVGVAQTLVHEMAHLWQHVHGKKKSRSAYHNDEWSQRMEAIGLQPSSTGEPGGKRVGQHMSDYVIVGGRFEQVFEAMPDALFFPFLSDGPDGKKSSSGGASKVKFTCQECGDHAWGKASLEIGCRKCGMPMTRDGAGRAPAPPAAAAPPAEASTSDVDEPGGAQADDEDAVDWNAIDAVFNDGARAAP